MPLEISKAARRDLSAIQVYSIRNYGVDHARGYCNNLIDQFKLIAQFPNIAPAKNIGKRKIHIHTYEAHNLVYMIKKDSVLIVRVLSRHQNWPNHI